MPTILLANDDVTVLGPPDTVEVLVDIGPQGNRGSQIFVGVGDPNLIEIGQTPEYNDLYINTSPGVDYGYMYQYVSEPGGDTWVRILEISPAIYSTIDSATFTSGNASITIPISNIVTVSGSPLTASNFNVQYSIVNANPIASSIEVPALIGAGTSLVINFHAVQYSSSVWSALSGAKDIHLFISIV